MILSIFAQIHLDVYPFVKVKNNVKKDNYYIKSSYRLSINFIDL